MSEVEPPMDTPGEPPDGRRRRRRAKTAKPRSRLSAAWSAFGDFALWDSRSTPLDWALEIGIGVYAAGSWVVRKLRGKRPV